MAAEQFNIDYYRLLGVNRNADEKTIRQAFRQLSRQHHPDKGGQEEMMKSLNKAIETLLDPDKRANYEPPNDNQRDLNVDFLRLNIGSRLSDQFKARIGQWKQEYQRIHINVNMNVLDELIAKLQETTLNITTVFNLHMDQLINQGKSEEAMLQELKALFVAEDFAKLAQYILTHQCRAALTKLYNDVKPTHGYELPCRQKALLLVIKASSTIVLADNHPHQRRINGLYDAVLTYPTEECIDCVLKLINNRVTDAHKQEFLNTIVTHNIFGENAVNKKYIERLDSTCALKSMTKFEDGIHKENIEPFEQAMLYIDLCMIYGHPMVLANNFVLAAKMLIERMHMLNSTDAAEAYALKNCVIDLCGTVLHFVSKYTNPISQVKYSTHVFRLMCESNYIFVSLIDGQHSNGDKEIKPLIGGHDQALFEIAIHCISKSIKVSPIIDTALDMTSDVVYIDLVNNKLLEKYYEWNIDTYPGHPSLHLYQYMLMEGSWKKWFEHTKFTERRQKCSKIMLSKFNTTESNMAKIMNAEISCIIPKPDDQSGAQSHSQMGASISSEPGSTDIIGTKPMIIRCEEGWMVPGANSLNMGKMSFNSVDGLVIDMERGTFEIIVHTNENIGPLCDGQDIDEIVTKGLSHSVFSLDQADYELEFHPFQLMRFLPKRLENSRYLATLLAADYLLKMIATNTEVSAQPPFKIKQATDGFLKALPADLRKYIMMKKEQTDYGKAHRFWIENGEIPCYENVDDNDNRIYEFYHTPMLVKKNLLKKNSNGELVDDSDDSEGDLTDEDSEDELVDDSDDSEAYRTDEGSEGETDNDLEDESNNEPVLPKKKISAEARFTRRFTEYYDVIGVHFPVLLRLRELAKLSAISQILRDISRSSGEKKQRLILLRDSVRKTLTDIGRDITYPICTESKINEEYWKTLHKYGYYDEDRVIWSERVRVKNEIRNDLNNDDEKLLNDILELLSTFYRISNTPALGEHCRNWLAHGRQEELVNYLCSTLCNCSVHDRIEKLSRFVDNLNARGINVTAEDGTYNDGGWVPATFSQLDGRSVYGGVALLPKLSLQTDRGFKGFQAKKGGKSGKRGSSGTSGGDNNGNGNGKKPKTRKEIMEKYGKKHKGKGEWPPEPIKAEDGGYFGKPGTRYKTKQGVIIKFGPSGWDPIHIIKSSTRKKAKDKAKLASKDQGSGKKTVISDPAHGKQNMKFDTFRDDQKKTDHYNKNKEGDNSSHFHITDEKGEKIWGPHYLHPK